MDLDANPFLGDIAVILSDIYSGSIVIEYQLQSINVLLLHAATTAIQKRSTSEPSSVTVGDWTFPVLSTQSIAEQETLLMTTEGVDSDDDTAFNFLDPSTYTLFEWMVVGVTVITSFVISVSLVCCVRSGIDFCCGGKEEPKLVHVELKEGKMSDHPLPSPMSMQNKFRVVRQRVGVDSKDLSDSEAGDPFSSPKKLLQCVQVPASE